MSSPSSARLNPPRPAFGRGLDAGARRLFGRLLLALALVLAQGGALTHFVGHFADVPHGRAGQSDTLRDDGPADLPGACADCLALAGIDLPLDGGHSHAPFVAAPHALPKGGAATPAQAAALPPRCRAPPALA